MTNTKEYVTITDEQLNLALSESDNLLIVGDCGSGKTKLINRVLAHLVAQPDSIFCCIDGWAMANHTGEDSYGHIEALRLNVDDLENILRNDKPQLQNTAINFPYPYYTEYPDNFLANGLYQYIKELSKLCVENHKRLVIVSDELDPYVNNNLAHISEFEPCKRVLSIVFKRDLDASLVSEFKTIQL